LLNCCRVIPCSLANCRKRAPAHTYRNRSEPASTFAYVDFPDPWGPLTVTTGSFRINLLSRSHGAFPSGICGITVLLALTPARYGTSRMTPNTLHSVPGTSWGVKGLLRHIVLQAILRSLTLYFLIGILGYIFKQLFSNCSIKKIMVLFRYNSL
jgi:hypothetical protein